MRKRRAFKSEIIAITLSLLVLIITASETIGQQARLVLILTIVAASLSVGISAGRLIERGKKEKDTAT